MSLVRKFIVSLLRLKEIFVVGYEFHLRDRALHLWVQPYKTGCRCPHCERRCTILHICSLARMWRDLPVCGWSVFFCYHPKKIFCPTHGRLQERIPWADPYARITYRFEYALLVYSQLMTHIFLCILAYHLLVAIEKKFLDQGIHMSWWSLRQTLSTHQVATVVLPTQNGTVLKIRKGSTPEPQHRDIYKILHIPSEVMKPVKTWQQKVKNSDLKNINYPELQGFLQHSAEVGLDSRPLLRINSGVPHRRCCAYCYTGKNKCK